LSFIVVSLKFIAARRAPSRMLQIMIFENLISVYKGQDQMECNNGRRGR
jgi:hypothetical protein